MYLTDPVKKEIRDELKREVHGLATNEIDFWFLRVVNVLSFADEFPKVSHALWVRGESRSVAALINSSDWEPIVAAILAMLRRRDEIEKPSRDWPEGLPKPVITPGRRSHSHGGRGKKDADGYKKGTNPS